MAKKAPTKYIISLFGLFWFVSGLHAQQDSVPKTNASDTIVKPAQAPKDDERIKAGERIDFVFTRGILVRGTLPDSFPIDASRSGSYSIGINYGIPIGKVLGLRFEPRLTWHNVYYKPEPQKTYPTDSNGIYHFEKERGFYVEMPVGFKFNLIRNEKRKVRLYMEFGAQGGYLLGSVYKRKSTVDGVSYVEKIGRVEDLNKLRYGFYARLGTQIFAAHVFYRITEVFNTSGGTTGRPNFGNLEIGFAVVF